MKTLVSTIIILFLYLNCKAQKEGYNWVFGQHAGITFNTEPPSTISGSKIATDEGCASISDKDGNLLFYTDGTTVWGKDNQPMPNGKNLYGDWSSTQSAVIVPIPLSNHRYYVFTVDSQGGSRGLCYSIVDMTLNNGMGAVSSKNIQLYTPTTEKITAVLHKNRKDIWLISHQGDNNIFQSYLITENGINNNPIISQSGHIIYPTPDGGGYIGYMKASPNGEYLGLANCWIHFVELFSFNNETGIVSNPIYFPKQSYAYGIEFSKDSKMMYFNTMDSISFDNTNIIQVDLSSKKEKDILNSALIIYSGNFVQGAMQLAPNGKIYSANYGLNTLSVIDSPEKKGQACNVIDKAITLEEGMNSWGLPTFIQSYFTENKSIAFTNSSACNLEAVNFKLSETINIKSINWDFGDGQFSSSIEASHSYSASGTYRVGVYVVDTSDQVYRGSKQITIPDKLKKLSITVN